jgi:hypothetical protein
MADKLDKKVLSGGKLAGGNPKEERVELDFYATNPVALTMLLDDYEFNGTQFLEPCVGMGHLANVIKNKYKGTRIDCLDIVDRGYEDTIVTDFLTWETDKKYDGIITNPPYSLGMEFVNKGIELLNDNGQMAMFLKIQFLEGVKRKEMYEKYPPKYIYVFRNRMATWNNGQKTDANGKKWSTTMCHCWMIWEKGSKSEPIVRWL